MPAPAQHTVPIGSLYVHVPFCVRKCSYCAFYSEASTGEWTNRYVASLTREMERVAADLRPRTIFFGGGTPSLLNLRQWQSILKTMDRLNLLGAGEWTVECNPATVSSDKAKLLRDFGVNRISMGVQSLDESLLERLGRIHSRAMVFKSFDILREAGFDNINVDLMFAIPGQTLGMWQETLREALALCAEHLACYEVIYEEDTPLFHQLQAGHVREDEDTACLMYEELIQQAEAAGLQQYEVANFARARRGHGLHPESSDPDPSLLPEFACRHNVNYWRGGSFYGLGPSATTYVRGVRTRNCSNIQNYCDQLDKGSRPVDFEETLAPLARAGETAAFGLRMVAGWPFEEFVQTTGHDLRQDWAGDMKQLAEQGWGRVVSDRFQLTREGMRFADSAARMFLR